MSLEKINISNVRNIKKAALSPQPNLNIILGENGSGKSSILEAIYLLGRARSFRTHVNLELVNSEEDRLLVSGTVSDLKKTQYRIGVGIEKSKKNVRINGVEARSKVELLSCFPLQIVTPLSYLLIEGPPTKRRQYIDWGVFHLENNYSEEWKRFNRCLVQRNATLKLGNNGQERVWDSEFAKYGTIIALRRMEYLRELAPYLQNIGQSMLPAKLIEVDYARGWRENQELLDVLKKDFKRDQKFGFTHSGPHKCELALKINGRPCKSYLSRGQIKLLVLVMTLAQIALLADRRDTGFGSLLIDDLCAELDKRNTDILKRLLSEQKLQCFITAMDRNSIGNLSDIESTMFHVEHGCVQEI